MKVLQLIIFFIILSYCQLYGWFQCDKCEHDITGTSDMEE